jgi:hypothetical protein
MQALFHNSTWIPSTTGGTYPDLALNGPSLVDSWERKQWEYCTVSLAGDFCKQINHTSQFSARPPKDAPRNPDPANTWSNITLDNHTYALQPPPLDIAWSGPARSWSISLHPRDPFAGYYSNGSIAQTAICQPSSEYQWGFSSILLFAFCCFTILFAATILGLEWDVYQHSQSIGYEQSRNSYRDAVYVVEALRESFGDDTIRKNPHQMDGHIRSWTGEMQVEILDFPPARSTRRLRPSDRNRLPDIPLLDHEAVEQSVTEATIVAK